MVAEKYGMLVTFSRQKGVENGMSGDTRVFFEHLTILNEIVQKFPFLQSSGF